MARERWRPEPTTNTMLVLLRDGRRRVRHVVIGSALLDVDWSVDLSLLMPDSEAPSWCELFSHSPQEARRAFRELVELGDVDPDPADFKQEWFPPAVGLATVNWLLYEAAQPRSKVRRLLGALATAELERIRGVLVAAERERWDFHLVEVREREGRRFAGREIVVGPENNEMQQARSATARRRGPRC
jgi:hypothetical protein